MLKKIDNKKMKENEMENKEIQIEKKELLQDVGNGFYKFLVGINFGGMNFERGKTYKLDENLINRFKINKIL